MTSPTASSPQQLYELIKSLEPNSPSLDPRSTVLIGTVDGQTGVFDWAIPLHEDPPSSASSRPDIAPPNGPPPPFYPGYYRFAISACVLITLRFQIVNRSGEFIVSGFGQVVTAPAGQDYIDLVLQTILPPGQNNASCLVQYGVSASMNSFPAAFVILQPPVAAAGAFTIPALPLSIIYALPQAAPGSSSKFVNQFTVTTSSARAVTTSVSSANSTKAATNYTASGYLTAAASAISDLVSVGEAIYSIEQPSSGAGNGNGNGNGASGSSPISKVNTYVKGVTGLLNLIAQNINSNTVSQQSAFTATNSSKATVTITEATQISTVPGPALGPGTGDIFYYLYNVQVAWLAVNGQLGILVLSYQDQADFTAQDLQAGDSILDTAIVDELLQLDPFTKKLSYPLMGNSSFYYLPAGRFNLVTSITYGPETNQQKTFQYSITQENTQASIQTQTTITDFKPGFLESVFGDNQTTEGTVTNSYSLTDDITVGEIVADQATIDVAPGDPAFTADIWYDVLFGTFAFVVPGQETQVPAFPLGPVSVHPVRS